MNRAERDVDLGERAVHLGRDEAGDRLRADHVIGVIERDISGAD